MKFCRASVCKLELWLSGPQSASIPCGISNCASSVQQTVKSFRTSVCLLEMCGYFLFFLFFGLCWNEALRLRFLKQIVKFCRASVCKLELWLSGPQSASIPCGICNCASSVQQTVLFGLCLLEMCGYFLFFSVFWIMLE